MILSGGIDPDESSESEDFGDASSDETTSSVPPTKKDANKESPKVETPKGKSKKFKKIKPLPAKGGTPVDRGKSVMLPAPHVDAPDPFDPASLRLSNSRVSDMGVKRVITTVRVGKPIKQEFVRCHPDMTYRLETALLEDKVNNEIYLVGQSLWGELTDEIRPMRLVTSVTRHGDVFLWPATLPKPDGKPLRWHESALAAQDIATQNWVRVTANMNAGEYSVYQATGHLPDPEWPNLDLGGLLKLAFQSRYITSMDHPILRTLRGEI